jgi:hypothetical protein
MAAIRKNRNEVADYLIDQLAVNVQYAADLQEFRVPSQIPIRHRILSCRDFAYDKGMMELVDLIDLTSNDVTPNMKRYLRNHLQARLNSIHQAYLKRLEERKHVLFQPPNKEKANQESPTENITNENITTSSMLPQITHCSPKSRIEETIESIDKSNEKSIDVTGKKIFRFSNYTLRFRLVETPDTKNKTNEQSSIKTTTPTLPNISLQTTNKIDRSISVNSSHLSMRNTCPSVRRSSFPQIIHADNKSSITTNTNRLSPKRVKQNNVKYSYISQPHALYNQPRRLMPVTLKSTAIGLPTDTRYTRD